MGSGQSRKHVEAIREAKGMHWLRKHQLSPGARMESVRDRKKLWAWAGGTLQAQAQQEWALLLAEGPGNPGDEPQGGGT